MSQFSAFKYIFSSFQVIWFQVIISNDLSNRLLLSGRTTLLDHFRLMFQLHARENVRKAKAFFLSMTLDVFQWIFLQLLDSQAKCWRMQKLNDCPECNICNHTAESIWFMLLKWYIDGTGFLTPPPLFYEESVYIGYPPFFPNLPILP